MNTIFSVLLFCLLMGTFAYSQEPIQTHITFDSIIPLDKIGDFGPASQNVVAAMTESFILGYLGSQDTVSDGFSFVRVALPSKAVDSFKVQIPNPDFPLLSFVARSIAVSSRYCALLFFKSVLILEFKDKALQFKRWIPLQFPYTYLGIQDTHIVVGRCYNHHPADAPHPTALQKINIETGSIIDSIHPQFHAIEFTHFDPSHWIDFSPNFTAFSQTLEYKIDIFDRNLNLVSTIRRTDGWKSMDTTALHTIRSRPEKTAPKRIIEELSKSEKSDGQRIMSVNFVSDSSLIVCSSAFLAKEKKNFTFYYDVWHFRNGTWELFLKDIMDMKPAGDAICQFENFPYFGVYYNSSYNREWAASVRVAPDSKIVFQVGKKYSQVKAEADDYISQYEPKFQIYLHKLNLQK